MNTADKKTLRLTGLAYLVLIALDVFLIVSTPDSPHDVQYASITFLVGIWIGLWISAFVNGRFKLIISNWSRAAEMVAQHNIVYPSKTAPYLYCPISQNNSYSAADISHKWCHYCHKFLLEVAK